VIGLWRVVSCLMSLLLISSHCRAMHAACVGYCAAHASYLQLHKGASRASVHSRLCTLLQHGVCSAYGIGAAACTYCGTLSLAGLAALNSWCMAGTVVAQHGALLLLAVQWHLLAVRLGCKQACTLQV
jgi:hypothetical protein